MYKCSKCGAISKKGDKRNTVSIVRDAEYSNARKVFDDKTKRSKTEYYTTTGYETKQEVHLCNKCYES